MLKIFTMKEILYFNVYSFLCEPVNQLTIKIYFFADISFLNTYIIVFLFDNILCKLLVKTSCTPLKIVIYYEANNSFMSFPIFAFSFFKYMEVIQKIWRPFV